MIKNLVIRITSEHGSFKVTLILYLMIHLRAWADMSSSGLLSTGSSQVKGSSSLPRVPSPELKMADASK